jgi:hypothetical protein
MNWWRSRKLGPMKATLLPRSFTIATFALCGFANLSSIGIQIGGIGALAPNRTNWRAWEPRDAGRRPWQSDVGVDCGNAAVDKVAQFHGLQRARDQAGTAIFSST